MSFSGLLNPELGLVATCWHCRRTFTKKNECEKCLLIICPNCGKCGCQLSFEARDAVYITLKAVLKTDYWDKLIREAGPAE